MRTNNVFLACSLTAALLVAMGTVSPAHCANIVTNGGFETGNFSGWTQFGDPNYTGVETGIAHTGNNAAYFGPIGDSGGIKQTLATTAGTTYDISFWLENAGDPPDALTATFGNSNLLTIINANAFGYTQYDYHVTATSNATVLSFAFRQDPSYFYLDDVSVQAVTGSSNGLLNTPEPGECATLATMLLAGGLSLRRARRKKA